MTGLYVQLGTAGLTGYVENGAGCHVWVGACTRDGYGMLWDGSKVRRITRLRYEREVGPIPEGLELDHFKCDNRACCNPAHLRPVTHRENTLRGNTIASIAASKTHCPRGHEYAGDNLLFYGRSRECRQCVRALAARRYHERRRLAREARSA